MSVSDFAYDGISVSQQWTIKKLDLTSARILKVGSGDLGVTTGIWIWKTLAVAAIPALKQKCIL